MLKRKWLIPPKHGGPPLRQVTLKLSVPLLEALKQRSAEESERLGRKVSQATILSTHALQNDERLEELYFANRLEALRKQQAQGQASGEST